MTLLAIFKHCCLSPPPEAMRLWRGTRPARRPVAVSAIGQEMAPGPRIPDLHSVVPGRGGDARTIRRPGQPPDGVGVAEEGGEIATGQRIPQQDAAIGSGSGDALAVRRPGDGQQGPVGSKAVESGSQRPGRH
jgi:hypothetical protein